MVVAEDKVNYNPTKKDMEPERNFTLTLSGINSENSLRNHDMFRWVRHISRFTHLGRIYGNTRLRDSLTEPMNSDLMKFINIKIEAKGVVGSGILVWGRPREVLNNDALGSSFKIIPDRQKHNLQQF